MTGGEVDIFSLQVQEAPDDTKRTEIDTLLQVHLPDEIRSLGFEQGEPVYLKLGSETVDCEEVDFIRGSTEEIGRNSYNLRHRSDRSPELHVRIPAEYTHYRENQVFHGLEAGDEVVVEVNYSSGEFRVYRSSDYPKRIQELSEESVFPKLKAPGVAALGAGIVKKLMGEYSEISDIPGRVSTGEEFELSFEVDFPGLELVAVQTREKGESVWTDYERFDEFSTGFAVLDSMISFSEPGVYELRLYIEYRDGMASSEVRTVEVV